MRAVGELQFLGFIKSTKRKTDHVERLTWGPCWWLNTICRAFRNAKFSE